MSADQRVAQLTEDEQLGLLGQRVTQGDVVLGEGLPVRVGVSELVELQPRKEEARDEGAGAIVGEHAVNLPLERSRVVQRVAFGVVAQRRIGRAIPQQPGESRGDIAAARYRRPRRVCAERLLD